MFALFLISTVLAAVFGNTVATLFGLAGCVVSGWSMYLEHIIRNSN